MFSNIAVSKKKIIKNEIDKYFFSFKKYCNDFQRKKVVSKYFIFLQIKFKKNNKNLKKE